MSISAMKQALEALELALNSHNVFLTTNPMQDAWQARQVEPQTRQAITALRQAIAEAEKQEPIFYVIQATDRFGEGYEQTYWEDPNGFPVYAAPVYASDISQERVDETAKREHEFECPRCGHCCKEWVGLTDGEMVDLLKECEGRLWSDGFRAIEAKIKEKNT
jgi:hypothetical protein